MSKILIITTGLTGILHASYKVVSLLENAGHNVIYACPWDVRKKVEKQGFKYRQLDEISFNPSSKVTEYQGKISKLLNAKNRRKKAVNSIKTEKFEKLIDEFQPNLVLIDMELHELIIVSVAKKVPTVLLSQWFSVWKNKDLPPIDTTIIPKNNQVELNEAWKKVNVKQLLSVNKSKFFSGFSDRASVLIEFARKKGFPTNEFCNEVAFPPPFIYKTLPVISLTDWELEFPHESRQNLHYVGSMVFEERKELLINDEIEKEIDELLVSSSELGLKMIYCSLSTMNRADEAFIDKIIKAVGAKKDWRMIIGLGGSSNLESLEHIPENIFAYEWIPQLKVLKNADCSINHGGIHTINECIHFGVPMLVYSGKKYDQNGCAARVSFHGAGIMADKDSDDVKSIQSKIEEILENETYSRRVLELRKARIENENKLVETIEKFLNSEKV